MNRISSDSNAFIFFQERKAVSEKTNLSDPVIKKSDNIPLSDEQSLTTLELKTKTKLNVEGELKSPSSFNFKIKTNLASRVNSVTDPQLSESLKKIEKNLFPVNILAGAGSEEIVQEIPNLGSSVHFELFSNTEESKWVDQPFQDKAFSLKAAYRVRTESQVWDKNEDMGKLFNDIKDYRNRMYNFDANSIVTSVDSTDQKIIGKKRALIVANSEYPNISDLAGAAKDKLISAKAYENQGFEKPVVLDNTNPEQIIKSLDSLIDQSEKGDMISFSYSGHGTREGLVGVDEKSYLSPKDLDKLIDKAKEKGVYLNIILDACHSGIFIQEQASKKLGELKNSYKEIAKIISDNPKLSESQKKSLNDDLLSGEKELKSAEKAVKAVEYLDKMPYKDFSALNDKISSLSKDEQIEEIFKYIRDNPVPNQQSSSSELSSEEKAIKSKSDTAKGLLIDHLLDHQVNDSLISFRAKLGSSFSELKTYLKK